MILSRIEGSPYSEIVPLWKGRTVVAIAWGPSVTPQQVDAVREAHAAGRVNCVVVNDAFLLAPWADVHYAADKKWRDWTRLGYKLLPGGGQVPNDKPLIGLTAAQISERWMSFAGQKCTIEWGFDAAEDGVHVLRNRDSDAHGMGLSRNPKMLATGRNSGAQAVNLIVLAGATTILLVGFDGGPDKDGKTHGHGGHLSPVNPEIWPYVRQSFSAMENDLIEMGVRVINCSPSSRIDSFPRMPIEEALAMEAA